jgi:hypothetical protein
MGRLCSKTLNLDKYLQSVGHKKNLTAEYHLRCLSLSGGVGGGDI